MISGEINCHDDDGEHNDLDEEDYYEASDDDEAYQMVSNLSSFFFLSENVKASILASEVMKILLHFVGW